MNMETRKGRCLCGRIEYEVSGPPKRVGLCHCTDCKRESGSAFQTFAAWPRGAFSSRGAHSTFAGRSFCPDCGSRLFDLTEDEAEIRLGSLDWPWAGLAPSYELWVKRRETWLDLLPGAEQFEEDRPHEG